MLLSGARLSAVVPHLGVGLFFPSTLLLAFSPRPELFSSPGLLLAHPKRPGVPNSGVSLHCPTPENPSPTPESPRPRVSPECSAQFQSLPRAPNPRVLLECPTPEYLYQERVGGGGWLPRSPPCAFSCFCSLTLLLAGQMRRSTMNRDTCPGFECLPVQGFYLVWGRV